VPGLGWESFTGVNAVFEHPDLLMTPVRREEEYHRLSHELFRFERIINRIGNISSDGFPTSHIYSFMMQVPMKHALSKAYAEWKSETGVKARVEPADNDTHITPAVAPDSAGYFANKGPIAWGASIVALTVIYGVKEYYRTSSFIELVGIIIFFNSFLIILGHLYLIRKIIWRNMDVLIDWSRDGLSRKALMKRQALMGIAIVAGEWWGYICAFQH
jgi:hypothetical protein